MEHGFWLNLSEGVYISKEILGSTTICRSMGRGWIVSICCFDQLHRLSDLRKQEMYSGSQSGGWEACAGICLASMRLHAAVGSNFSLCYSICPKLLNICTSRDSKVEEKWDLAQSLQVDCGMVQSNGGHFYEGKKRLKGTAPIQPLSQQREVSLL